MGTLQGFFGFYIFASLLNGNQRKNLLLQKLEFFPIIVDPFERACTSSKQEVTKLSPFNPIALRMAKTLWSFGHSECKRVNRKWGKTWRCTLIAEEKLSVKCQIYPLAMQLWARFFKALLA